MSAPVPATMFWKGVGRFCLQSLTVLERTLCNISCSCISSWREESVLIRSASSVVRQCYDAAVATLVCLLRKHSLFQGTLDWGRKICQTPCELRCGFDSTPLTFSVTFPSLSPSRWSTETSLYHIELLSFCQLLF